jgi:hypothetical protein
MKSLPTAGLWALLMLSLAATAQDTTNASTTVMNQSSQTGFTSMKGAYDMLVQKVSIDGEDSLSNVRQFKIYTDRHFMYAHALPGDSLADFGIGTYRVQNNKVIEYPFYTAASGPVQDSFVLGIMKTADGYSQIINLPPDNQGRRYMLIEDYRDASRNVRSPLDGAWKMTRLTLYPKGGKPTVINNPVQFKVYQSGHVIWANSELDSATQRRVAFFGFGNFKMNGANKAVETITQSTYRSQLQGQSVTLQLAFQGKDRYQQTIVSANGDRMVEEYERLK